jgi:hypothetical protein
MACPRPDCFGLATKTGREGSALEPSGGMATGTCRLEGFAPTSLNQGVLLYQRLMNFSQTVLARLRDKRKSRRYPVGPRFPLKATIKLAGREQLDASASDSGMEWSGPLADLSGAGVRLMLPPSALTVRGEETVLQLSLEAYRLNIPCSVAYLRVYTGYAACGLALKFPDVVTRKSYLQLLESVAVGATMAAVPSARFLRRQPGLVSEQYKSDNGTLLTVWRRTSSREFDSFELLAGDHCLRGESASRELVLFSRRKPLHPTHRAITAPRFGPTTELRDEIIRFFRCTVPNFPKSVPRDLRGWLAGFADNAPPSSPVGNGSEARSVSPLSSASPSSWASPAPTKSRSRPPVAAGEKLPLASRAPLR